MGARAKDPYLDAGVQGYIVNEARRQFWKMASWYELDDLIQDGYMCYYKCRHKPEYVAQLSSEENPSDEDRRWMMSLLKVTFHRHITTLATKRMGVADAVHDEVEVAVSQLGRDEDAGDMWGNIAPAQPEEASLRALLASMPAELQQLIVLLAGDGAEALGFERSRLERRVLPSGSVRVQRRGKRRLRETTNEYYCRLLGLDPRLSDVRALLASHLRGDSA